MPNKMWEYIAAGIPQIVLNARTPGLFVDNLGLGKYVKSAEEIPDALDELYRDKVADDVWKLRKNWTMEKQYTKIMSLYVEILGLPKSKTLEL